MACGTFRVKNEQEIRIMGEGWVGCMLSRFNCRFLLKAHLMAKDCLILFEGCMYSYFQLVVVCIIFCSIS